MPNQNISSSENDNGSHERKICPNMKYTMVKIDSSHCIILHLLFGRAFTWIGIYLNSGNLFLEMISVSGFSHIISLSSTNC